MFHSLVLQLSQSISYVRDNNTNSYAISDIRAAGLLWALFIQRDEYRSVGRDMTALHGRT